MLEAVPNTFHTAARNERTKNKSRRFISAEIEVAGLKKKDLNTRVYNACKQWKAGIVHDGSLPDSGFEINTAPASGDKFVNQINAIGEALSDCKANVTESCGLHVHVDARDFNYWEIRRLIRVYALIEDALFSVVSKSRRNNHYCARCGEEYLHAVLTGSNPRKVKDTIARAVYKSTGDVHERRKNKYESARYSALNLHSWYYRGTVECRLFNGTTSAEKIINWGMLWAGILDWVYSHTDRDVDALCKVESSWEALMAVAPTNEIRGWLSARRDEFKSN